MPHVNSKDPKQHTYNNMEIEGKQPKAKRCALRKFTIYELVFGLNIFISESILSKQASKHKQIIG